jgi:hypothetical protein
MQDAFVALHAHTRQQTADLARMVSEGLLTPEGFGDRMAKLLEDAHTQAVVLGRMHAGDRAPVEADDRAFAEAIVDGESEYLAAFVRDLADGRYQDDGGAWRVQGMQNRAGMYADRLLGTVNEAWGLAMPEGTLYYWHLGGDELTSCGRCPELAESGPWTAAEMPTWPGLNETPCLGNCRCWTSTPDGQIGFRLIG